MGRFFYSIFRDLSSSFIMAKPLIFCLFLLFLMQNAAIAQQKSIDVDSLMQLAIDRADQNNPQDVLDHFSYTTYEKTIITDSLERENNAHSFFTEKVSKNNFNTYHGFKEEVLGFNMAGFKEPRYEVLGITLQSRSFYDEDFVIFNYRYAGPLSSRGLNNYNYEFVGDTTILDRKGYAVAFYPERPKTIPGLEGILYLDVESLAIQKVHIGINDELVARIEQEYEYLPEVEVYMPRASKLYIEKGESSKRLSLFRGKVSVGTIQNNPVKEAIEGRYLLLTSYNTNFNLSKGEKLEHPKLAIEVMEGADEKSEDFWTRYRNQALTERDLNSFDYLDTIVETENIERRLAVINNFGIGYYTVDFFDFDLTYPLKYNNYEGLRLGIGGVTNADFSKNFRVEGYTAYGFRDKVLKYGIGGGVLLNESHGAWLSLSYNDDLQETGSFNYLTDRRVYSLFEPRLVNITQFFDYQTFRLNQEYQITPKILSEFQFAKTNVLQTEAYRFVLGDESYSEYDITEATFGVRWSPSSKFMRSEKGTVEIYDGYPKVTAQISKGISGLFNGDFDFTRVGAKFYYQVERLNKSTTEFLIEGKMAFGDVPLTHLFHAYPNAPTKQTIMQRFSVAGVNSFETMYFGEFFSDRLATLQIKHHLRPFNLGEKFKPELVFISRYAIGDISDIARHQDVTFGKLNKGFMESGFEINKILFGFGTSLTYRYGAYHLPSFADNIAFKFTFNLQL
ncbi:DUF5686 family protein [Leeuwenhoekiella marinoflava]|uniref:Uncharacterized protein n=2 Tax=Leeuwenhoekiella marinoflava TaxID=988 RepID=A0A4Q0P6U3_9FLAO|nr:DUF5686 family protein [Leeuwenhoekiella marinoflava]RXG22390.1 hypothetical protein DSL99_3956 [Leeuwenhoekiella marinoflava]SHF31668.1 hypothetical protein SAMN02745246_02173 [Leeuwenhoekiella marinoflava DSM 3653]